MLPTQMAWSNKEKAEIFTHLEEMGISQAAARDLLQSPPEGSPSKADGLTLIKAASRTLSSVSLLFSPWVEVAQFWMTEFDQALPEYEEVGARASLMIPWTAYSLRALAIAAPESVGDAAENLIYEGEDDPDSDAKLIDPFLRPPPGPPPPSGGFVPEGFLGEDF